MTEDPFDYSSPFNEGNKDSLKKFQDWYETIKENCKHISEYRVHQETLGMLEGINTPGETKYFVGDYEVQRVLWSELRLLLDEARGVVGFGKSKGFDSYKVMGDGSLMYVCEY